MYERRIAYFGPFESLMLFAVVAIVIGGMTIWKLSLSGFNVDPKAGAEIAACFAASYFFLK